MLVSSRTCLEIYIKVESARHPVSRMQDAARIGGLTEKGQVIPNRSTTAGRDVPQRRKRKIPLPLKPYDPKAAARPKRSALPRDETGN